MHRDVRGFLWDIARAGDDIAVFTAGQDAETFLENRLVHAAVERKFEIIGEALSQLAKLDPVLVERIPDFRRAISFRNLLIHGYATVDMYRVWHTVEDVLPGLRAVVADLLAELGPP
jgi:uncharacterized protein with HEPN domain